MMNITDDTFEAEVLNSPLPVLVDFWAEWCGPCMMLTPILEEVASLYTDKLKIVKLNIDSSTAIPQQYSIRGIPTLILFSEGEAVATKVGTISKSQLIAFLDSNL